MNRAYFWTCPWCRKIFQAKGIDLDWRETGDRPAAAELDCGVRVKWWVEKNGKEG